MKMTIGLKFEILGHNNGYYYYLPDSTNQIVRLSAKQHTIRNLMRLDRLEAWELPWINGEGILSVSHAKIAIHAANILMIAAHKKGLYNSESTGQ